MSKSSPLNYLDSVGGGSAGGRSEQRCLKCRKCHCFVFVADHVLPTLVSWYFRCRPPGEEKEYMTCCCQCRCCGASQDDECSNFDLVCRVECQVKLMSCRHQHIYLLAITSNIDYCSSFGSVELKFEIESVVILIC